MKNTRLLSQSAGLLMVLALLGCSKTDAPAEGGKPVVAVESGKTEQPADNRKADAPAEARKPEPSPAVVSFQAGPRFTLVCKGEYSMVTNEKEARHGTQAFSLSVDTQAKTAYPFGWFATGWMHGPHKAMADKVFNVEDITEDTIHIGVLEIDRKTLKYTTAATAGLCELSDDYTPIPTRQI